MRKVKLNFTYEGKDISADIAPHVLGWSYTDFSHGKADDFQVNLEDSRGLWKGSWFPQKGALIRAGIEADGKRLSFGSFAIDEITASGPPSTVTIKAASSLITKPLRREKKTRAWENITFQQIVSEIAGAHGLTGFYSAGNLDFKRIDQREESDLTFLKRLADENGLNLKLSEEKIIVFEGKKFEEQPAVLFVRPKEDGLTRYNFTSKSHDIFRACQVTYRDPEGKQDLVHVFTPPNAPTMGQVLKVNARVESLGQAETRARNELRRKNKNEITGSLSFMGRPDLLGGMNIELSGFGYFSGKYFIEEARHAQTAAYETTCKIRKVMNY